MGATTNYIILHHETWTSWKRAINLYGFPIRKRVFLFQKKEKNKTSLPTTSLFFLYSRIFSLISPSPFPSPSHLRKISKKFGRLSFPLFAWFQANFHIEASAHSFRWADRNLDAAMAATAAEGSLRVCRKFSITRRRRRRRAGLLRARGRTLGAARNTVGNTWLGSTRPCSLPPSLSP